VSKHYDQPGEQPERKSYPFPKLQKSGAHRRGPVPKTRQEASFEALQQRKRKESLPEKYRKYDGKHRKKGS
jgi:hypothetical protein